MIDLNNKLYTQLKATAGRIDTKLWESHMNTHDYGNLILKESNSTLTKLYTFSINNPVRNIRRLIKY